MMRDPCIVQDKGMHACIRAYLELEKYGMLQTVCDEEAPCWLVAVH